MLEQLLHIIAGELVGKADESLAAHESGKVKAGAVSRHCLFIESPLLPPG
jgi:hypothetical protein